jgi:saposin
VAKYAEDYIQSNATESQILAGVEKICAVLPGDLSAQCKSLIDQYLPSIITIILNGETPEKVCQIFGLCPTLRLQDNCSTCTLIATLAESLLKSNQTQAQIAAALDQICNILPSSIAGECKALINNNLNNIIAFLLVKETPEAICKLLGLC